MHCFLEVLVVVEVAGAVVVLVGIEVDIAMELVGYHILDLDDPSNLDYRCWNKDHISGFAVLEILPWHWLVGWVPPLVMLGKHRWHAPRESICQKHLPPCFG